MASFGSPLPSMPSIPKVATEVMDALWLGHYGQLKADRDTVFSDQEVNWSLSHEPSHNSRNSNDAFLYACYDTWLGVTAKKPTEVACLNGYYRINGFIYHISTVVKFKSTNIFSKKLLHAAAYDSDSGIYLFNHIKFSPSELIFSPMGAQQEATEGGTSYHSKK